MRHYGEKQNKKEEMAECLASWNDKSEGSQECGWSWTRSITMLQKKVSHVTMWVTPGINDILGKAQLKSNHIIFS